jgi:ketosteroid isomerase-like protein
MGLGLRHQPNLNPDHPMSTPTRTQAELNVRVVQDAFAAFAARDLKTVLALLDPDIEWQGARAREIPYGGHYHGRDAVEKFFKTLGQNIEYEYFEASEYVSHNERVVALGRERFRVKSTGRHVENEWAMVLTVRQGKIARFRVYEDTAAIVAGFKPA